MPPPSKARKTSGGHPTFRKQPHGSTRPDSRTNTFSIARKSTQPGVPPKAPHGTVHDSTGASNTQSASHLLITSHPYAIAGVAGFHRGAKPPVIGWSQLDRRLKPVPHKNVSGSRIDHPKIPRDMNPSDRILDGAVAKSRARRTKAVAQPSSNMKRSLLLNQHRNQIDSAVYADIVFGGTTPIKHYKLVTQSSSDEEKKTPKPANYVTPGRARGPAGAGYNDTVWKTMIASFGALSLSTVTAAKKRRLPFLRRVLRTSFLRRCQMIGLAVNSISPQAQPLTILYKMPIDVSENEWDNEVTEYAVHKVKLTLDQLVCPLCDILGRLITKEMLEAHLEWDHLEVETSWRKRKNGGWELVLELPGVDMEEAESSRSSSPQPSVPPWSPVSTSQLSETGHGSPQAVAREATTTSTIEDPVPICKFKREFLPTPASRTASLVPDAFRDCLQQSPRAGDPLGALGTHPYLPLLSADDDDDDQGFPCRPWGPRLFDLVARHTISRYGLTSWSLLERDEELFEIDDVRDEEKAIQSLWNRWIFFQRRKYLLDPRETVIKFLEASKDTIVKTAGWKGVRVWLLLLAKHKYLTGDDVVTAMIHYETLAGIGP